MIGPAMLAEARAKIDLECAIEDAKGDALLMILALEDATNAANEAWDVYKLKRPGEDWHLLLITGDQYAALVHGCYRLQRSVREVHERFHTEGLE